MRGSAPDSASAAPFNIPTTELLSVEREWQVRIRGWGIAESGPVVLSICRSTVAPDCKSSPMAACTCQQHNREKCNTQDVHVDMEQPKLTTQAHSNGIEWGYGVLLYSHGGTGGVETHILTPTPAETFWAPWEWGVLWGGWGHLVVGVMGTPTSIPQNDPLVAPIILNTHM